MLPPPINATKSAAPAPTPRAAPPAAAAIQAQASEQPPVMESDSSQPVPETSTLTNPDGTIRPMWKIEREAIQNAINYCDGNVLNAAVLLELSPSTVYRKKQAWESEDECSQA